MALFVGLTAAFSGFAAALGLVSSLGFTFTGALLIGADSETAKGLAWLFAPISLPVLAAGRLLLALPGALTLLLDFVLAMTKAHQKGFNPSELGQ